MHRWVALPDGGDDFAPLVALPGTEWVSLQVGAQAEELRQSGWQGLIHDASGEVRSIEATADALAEVDLVITVDTMLARLAGVGTGGGQVGLLARDV